MSNSRLYMLHAVSATTHPDPQAPRASSQAGVSAALAFAAASATALCALISTFSASVFLDQLHAGIFRQLPFEAHAPATSMGGREAHSHPRYRLAMPVPATKTFTLASE